MNLNVKVLQSKYMHSHGVRHDDIKPDNIMLRKHKSFLIDFNYSSKLMEFNDIRTAKYSSRSADENKLRSAIDDWESFLYSLCFLNNIDLMWFSKTNRIFRDPSELSEWYLIMSKEQTDMTTVSI